jgi:GxxExxY protein
MEPLRHSETTRLLLQAFYDVYNKLGYGFLERVYENAMAISCRKLGLCVEQQIPIRVHFEGTVLGKYYPDLLVNDEVIFEVKAVRARAEQHEAHC